MAIQRQVELDNHKCFFG